MLIEAITPASPEDKVVVKKIHPEAQVALEGLLRFAVLQVPNITIDEVIAQAVYFIKHIDDQQAMGKTLMGDVVHGYNADTRRVDVEAYRASSSRELAPDDLVPIEYATEETVESQIVALARKHSSPDNPVSPEQEFEQILLRTNFYLEHFYASGSELFMRDTDTYHDSAIDFPFKAKKEGLGKRIRKFTGIIGRRGK
jgi:hypothetical protein